MALGVAVGLEEAPVPRRLAAWGTNLIAALVVLSVTMVAGSAATRCLQHLAQRKRMGAALTGLGTTLSKVVIFVLGGLVILETLGIPVTPPVTALGAGGIAVALALQDILSNLFAGIYLLVERPLRVGEVVKLETGQEGTVADIGWRITRIRMPPNSTIIVPNGKLAQSVLTVRDRQDPRAVAVDAGNHPGEA